MKTQKGTATSHFRSFLGRGVKWEDLQNQANEWINNKIQPIKQEDSKATYCWQKDISKENRPRERLEKNGVHVLSDAELLAIIFKTGNKKENAK